jgi:hypothetical protein
MLLDSANFINLTTTQKNAISSPKTGTVVYDTTLGQLSIYNGSSWISFATVTGSQVLTNKTLTDPIINAVSGPIPFTASVGAGILSLLPNGGGLTNSFQFNLGGGILSLYSYNGGAYPVGFQQDQSGDIYTVAWQDYSVTSTIVGWSSISNKYIYYKKIGKIVFILYQIAGTSNAINASFTVPYNNTPKSLDVVNGYAGDNGGAAVVGLVELPANSSAVGCYANANGGSFTASGTKTVLGQFWYQSA